jgi:peptide chain release factor 3
MRVFRPGRRNERETEIIEGLGNPAIDARFPALADATRQEIELIRGASPEFDHAAFLSGAQTPVFFGSAINNFGVREILDSLVELAPPPGSQGVSTPGATGRKPDSQEVVFKIRPI